jgi:hypothetical protein
MGETGVVGQVGNLRRVANPPGAAYQPARGMASCPTEQHSRIQIRVCPCRHPKNAGEDAAAQRAPRRPEARSTESVAAREDTAGL